MPAPGMAGLGHGTQPEFLVALVWHGRAPFARPWFRALSDTIRFVPDTVIIDGNNLLHAVRVLGPTRPPGRESLLKIIERWAIEHHNVVILVFDGPRPHGAFGEQMRSERIEVLFSGARTADDCIVERLATLPNPDRVLVVSDDTAIQYEARRQRCRSVSTTIFIASLFPPDSGSVGRAPSAAESVGDKPSNITQRERNEWLASFDDGKSDEPFDGFDAMMQ